MNALPEYSVDWQHLIVLLYALDNIDGGIPTRQETVDFIRTQGLLFLRPEDRKPYPSQTEPSWQTDIAFARKNGVIFGFINNTEWNSWEIFRDGRDFLRQAEAKCASKTIDVSKCFLWSVKLKKQLYSEFKPSPSDPLPPPKGDRTMPDLRYYQKLIDERLKEASIEELAGRLSAKLGHPVSPTRASVAYGYHLYILSIL